MRQRCQHRVYPPAMRGACDRCGLEVVANGCGPGFIEQATVDDETSGWHVCSNGLARWFGTPETKGVAL